MNIHSENGSMRESVACNLLVGMEPGFKLLYIFGAGGHGRELAWLTSQIWGSKVALCFVVDDAFVGNRKVDDISVRPLSSAEPSTDSRFIVALGQGAARRRAAAKCDALGLLPTALIHPRVEMSARTRVAGGAVICAGSILTTNVSIGEHVHVNIGCTISHDVAIGDFSTLSPGVHISGHVHVGRDVFIGTGASIINGSAAEPLVIGDGAVIAAGACVTRSVDPGALMAGVPAIRKR